MNRARDDLAEVLAEVLAEGQRESSADLRPRVAATALIGVRQALVDHVRRRVLAGGDLTGLAAEVLELATGAFELLDRGLRGYGDEPQ